MAGDARYKAFTTGDLYPYLETGEIFICPSVPKGAPESTSDVFGFDSAFEKPGAKINAL